MSHQAEGLIFLQQAGTASDVIAAIPAAISADTSLLLGLWASGGPDAFNNELTALRAAISTYGASLASRVAGISIGSEDLYRVSPIGIAAKAGIGAGPDVVSNYIAQVRSTIANTPLSGAPVGHVDTWTAWVNGSNNAVIQNSDFIGMDAYPYFQNTVANSIDAGSALFLEALANTTAAAAGKPVWLTETGWPVSGPTENLGVPSLANAKTYWDQVGCAVAFGKYNTWWYALRDAAPTTPSPSFGVVGSTLSNTPLYDLSCSANTISSSSSASSSKSTTSASSAASSTSSVASSIGASRIASAQAGVTSVAGSGPIVVSADSSLSAMAAAATGASASRVASSGATPSTASAAPGAAGLGGAAAGTGAPVAPASGGVNTTASSGNSSTSAKPSASTYTGGAAILSGTAFSAVGLLVAVVAAL